MHRVPVGSIPLVRILSERVPKAAFRSRNSPLPGGHPTVNIFWLKIRPHPPHPFLQRIGLGTFALASGMWVSACGAGPQIGGNWYAADPHYTPDPATPISGVGFALVDDNGKLSGNVTTYLRVSQTACGSLAFALSATGSIDAGNRVALAATDGIVSFIFDGTLDSTRRFFTNGNDTVSGSEAY